MFAFTHVRYDIAQSDVVLTHEPLFLLEPIGAALVFAV